MNVSLVSNYNSVVSNEDTVYILGDLMLGQDYQKGLELIKSLNGQKVIVAGNHDTNKRRDLYENELGLKVFDATTFSYNGYHFYLSHYPTICSNNDDDKPLKARIINLCGHSHTKDPFIELKERGISSYHVEIEAQNNYPVSIDTIIENIKTFGKFS